MLFDCSLRVELIAKHLHFDLNTKNALSCHEIIYSEKVEN